MGMRAASRGCVVSEMTFAGMCTCTCMKGRIPILVLILTRDLDLDLILRFCIWVYEVGRAYRTVCTDSCIYAYTHIRCSISGDERICADGLYDGHPRQTGLIFDVSSVRFSGDGDGYVPGADGTGMDGPLWATRG